MAAIRAWVNEIIFSPLCLVGYKINRSGLERSCFHSGLLLAVCTAKLSKISLSSKPTLPLWEAESQCPQSAHAEQALCGHN